MPEEQPKTEQQISSKQVEIIERYKKDIEQLDDKTKAIHMQKLEELLRIINKDYKDPIFKYVERGNKYVFIRNAKDHVIEERDGQFEEIRKTLTPDEC